MRLSAIAGLVAFLCLVFQGGLDCQPEAERNETETTTVEKFTTAISGSDTRSTITEKENNRDDSTGLVKKDLNENNQTTNAARIATESAVGDNQDKGSLSDGEEFNARRLDSKESTSTLPREEVTTEAIKIDEGSVVTSTTTVTENLLGSTTEQSKMSTDEPTDEPTDEHITSSTESANETTTPPDTKSTTTEAVGELTTPPTLTSRSTTVQAAPGAEKSTKLTSVTQSVSESTSESTTPSMSTVEASSTSTASETLSESTTDHTKMSTFEPTDENITSSTTMTATSTELAIDTSSQSGTAPTTTVGVQESITSSTTVTSTEFAIGITSSTEAVQETTSRTTRTDVTTEQGTTATEKPTQLTSMTQSVSESTAESMTPSMSTVEITSISTVAETSSNSTAERDKTSTVEPTGEDIASSTKMTSTESANETTTQQATTSTIEAVDELTSPSTMTSNATAEQVTTGTAEATQSTDAVQETTSQSTRTDVTTERGTTATEKPTQSTPVTESVSESATETVTSSMSTVENTSITAATETSSGSSKEQGKTSTVEPTDETCAGSTIVTATSTELDIDTTRELVTTSTTTEVVEEPKLPPTEAAVTPTPEPKPTTCTPLPPTQAPATKPPATRSPVIPGPSPPKPQTPSTAKPDKPTDPGTEGPEKREATTSAPEEPTTTPVPVLEKPIVVTKHLKHMANKQLTVTMENPSPSKLAISWNITNELATRRRRAAIRYYNAEPSEQSFCISFELQPTAGEALQSDCTPGNSTTTTGEVVMDVRPNEVYSVKYNVNYTSESHGPTMSEGDVLDIVRTKPASKEEKSHNVVVIASVSCFVVVFGLIVAAIYMNGRKKRTRALSVVSLEVGNPFSNNNVMRMSDLRGRAPNYTYDNEGLDTSAERSATINRHPALPRYESSIESFNPVAYSKPIKINQFQAHFEGMKRDGDIKFTEEFDELEKLSKMKFAVRASHKAGRLPHNRYKNRFVNVLPFDHSRVPLAVKDNDVSSNYINADFIPGVSSPCEYIATQGPLKATKGDFWRMVWEHNVRVIVMVTQLRERQGVVKCERYWPLPNEGDEEDEDSKALDFSGQSVKPQMNIGNFDVQLVSQRPEGNFVVREFVLQKGSKLRIVKQFHFVKWPDFGSPEEPTSLVEFIEVVRVHADEVRTPNGEGAPILIHCSAGIGRTATFIAVDTIRQQLQNDTNVGYVDIFGVVANLRQFRPRMVQTVDQYIYIHECVGQMLSNQTDSLQEDFAMRV